MDMRVERKGDLERSNKWETKQKQEMTGLGNYCHVNI